MRTLKKQRLEVFLSGYYGQCNTGDDALAAVIAWGLHRYFMPKRINIAAPPLVVPAEIPARFFPAKKLFRGHFRIVKTIMLLRSNLWVLGGGSVLHDVTGPNVLVRTRRALSAYKNLTRGKVIAIGISLGPIQNRCATRFLADILNLMEFAVLRDKASMHMATFLGLQAKCFLAPDPAVLLPLIGLQVPVYRFVEPRSPVISVAPCDYYRFVTNTQDYRDYRRNQAIALALAKVVQRTGALVRLIAFNGHPSFGDSNAIAQIAKYLPSSHVEIIPYHPNPMHAFNLVENSDCVVATRLHAAIFAFAAGVPFIAICYHPKVMDFAQYVGVPEKYVFTEDNLDADTLQSTIEEVLDAPRSFSTKMHVREAQYLAIKGFLKAAQVLSIVK